MNENRSFFQSVCDKFKVVDIRQSKKKVLSKNVHKLVSIVCYVIQHTHWNQKNSPNDFILYNYHEF